MTNPSFPQDSYVPNELLVQFAPQTSSQDRANVRAALGAKLAEKIHTQTMVNNGNGVLERLTLPPGLSVEQAIAIIEKRPEVNFAEPNWILTTEATSSDDPYYTNGSLWGMYGDDSAISPSTATNEYGSQAEEAWAQGYSGSNDVYVGIIDTGIQIDHPDLDANIWTNAQDTVDGSDNDGNGYVDDINGWDFANNDRTVYDGGTTGNLDDHGTHVAGTIGAKNSGLGVVGVNHNVTMISAKFLGSNGGTTANAIKAIDYITNLKASKGLNIVATNNSWGGGGYSQGLHDAILRAAKAEILFIAAAGNGGSDGVGDNNDSTANYPSNYSTLISTSTEAAAGYEAVIAVAAITSTGAISSFSNYGAATVDLGAPGQDIWSTTAYNMLSRYNGTSMATPHVTGAAALLKAAFPNATAAQIREAILNGATPTSSLSGKTLTGGRLNIPDALTKLETILAGGTTPPPPPVVPENQIIWGSTAADTLSGGAGDDRIAGVPELGTFLGKGTIDTLTGMEGKDVFLLADGRGVFYNDGNSKNAGKGDYALITDFDVTQDKIQLKSGSQYLYGYETLNGTVGTAIYLGNGDRRFNSADELIGFLNTPLVPNDGLIREIPANSSTIPPWVSLIP